MDKLHDNRKPHECGDKGLVSSNCTVTELKSKQCAKIKEIRTALISLGYLSLDEQAAVLGLGRSTAWAVMKGNHKASGLSATILSRMLGAPGLPDAVGVKILEYVQEKAAGIYGHSHKQRQQFIARLSARRAAVPVLSSGSAERACDVMNPVSNTDIAQQLKSIS